MKIQRAQYLKDYLLKVTFNNREIRIVDFEKFLRTARNPMSAQFLNTDRFKKVQVANGDLTWENGQMDFSADCIYKGELLFPDATNLEELKFKLELLETTAGNQELSAERLVLLQEEQRITSLRIGVLKSHYQNPEFKNVELTIAFLEGVGVCVFTDVGPFGQIAELEPVSKQEGKYLGSRIEVFAGKDGHLYWKSSGNLSTAYDRFFQIVEILDDQKTSSV